jgi:hypothetical protein
MHMAVWPFIDAPAADVTHRALQRLYAFFVRLPWVCAGKRERGKYLNQEETLQNHPTSGNEITERVGTLVTKAWVCQTQYTLIRQK